MIKLLMSVNHLDDQDKYKMFEIKVPDVWGGGGCFVFLDVDQSPEHKNFAFSCHQFSHFCAHVGTCVCVCFINEAPRTLTSANAAEDTVSQNN